MKMFQTRRSLPCCNCARRRGSRTTLRYLTFNFTPTCNISFKNKKTPTLVQWRLPTTRRWPQHWKHLPYTAKAWRAMVDCIRLSCQLGADPLPQPPDKGPTSGPTGGWGWGRRLPISLTSDQQAHYAHPPPVKQTDFNTKPICFCRLFLCFFCVPE